MDSYKKRTQLEIKDCKERIYKEEIEINLINWLFKICPNHEEDPRMFMSMCKGVLQSKEEFLEKYEVELGELKERLTMFK